MCEILFCVLIEARRVLFNIFSINVCMYESQIKNHLGCSKKEFLVLRQDLSKLLSVQAGLELSNLPFSASQSDGVTSMCHQHPSAIKTMVTKKTPKKQKPKVTFHV